MSDNEPGEGYQPIPCGLYSEYEVAIMHRTPLRLHWRDEAGVEHIDRVVAQDLQTREHCEYLLARDCADGSHLEIRLDRILFKLEEAS